MFFQGQRNPPNPAELIREEVFRYAKNNMALVSISWICISAEKSFWTNFYNWFARRVSPQNFGQKCARFYWIKIASKLVDRCGSTIQWWELRRQSKIKKDNTIVKSNKRLLIFIIYNWNVFNTAHLVCIYLEFHQKTKLNISSGSWPSVANDT